ncbi:MAG: DNA translocase FtsK 4TM domain-containing protein [Candidatus Atribacteria bacterium]|nr:DNA translocase FtsK 4TM domain-containing protein [Candidatus Atribacteria bacterium]
MVKKNNVQHSLIRKIIGVLLIISALYSLISFLIPINNLSFFIEIMNYLNSIFGFGRYFLLILIGLVGLILLLGVHYPNLYNKVFGITAILLIILPFIHLKLIFIDDAYPLAKTGVGGGLYGHYMANYLYNYFGLTGSYLFLVAMGLIAILFITEASFFYLFNVIFKKIVSIFSSIMLNIRAKPEKSQKRFKSMNLNGSSENQNEMNTRKVEPIFKKSTVVKSQQNVDKVTTVGVQEKINFGSQNHTSEQNKSYIIPPIEILNEVKKEQKTKGLEKIKSNMELLQQTLDNFGIQGEVVGATKGPTVTRYEIQPAPGVKVSKITNLSNDIALAFASPSVRIEAPIPGKNAIGIEVPNKDKDTVLLREVIESKEYQNNSLILPIALGKDIGGKTIIADLVDLPHLLIAGSTGSGKSVCLNSIIISLIYRFGPDMVKFVMVDPKRVELNIFNGIPHLIMPIVTNTKKVDKVLSWALSEMESRFKIFAEVGVRNLKGYHDYIKSIRSDDKSLPYIVIIIDELADLMLSSPVKVEESLCRLAQMTRATGIHLIIATQRPSVDIITGSIKINFPSRIAFAVSTQVDSRTILDVNGAEKLLGNGDMLFSPINASKPIRAQGSYVSEREIKDIVSFLEKNGPSQNFHEDILENSKSHSDEVGEEDESDTEEQDELFDEAVETIINNKQASISILQRKLRIGYTRAARLIDLMEQKEIVGPYDGRNPRKILLSREEYLNKYNE